MILTEDKTYTMSLETEDNSSDSVLTNKTVELEFSNKELLHAIITCGMPIQRLTAAYPEKRRLEVLYKLFLVETALDTEETGSRRPGRSLTWILRRRVLFPIIWACFYKDDQQPAVWNRLSYTAEPDP